MPTYIFDLDNTLCSDTNGNYKEAKPFLDRIKRVNELHKKNIIIIYTGRGLKTKSQALTRKQLKEWGVKYHELIFKKPFYHFWVDDRCIKDKHFFK
jgi:FMN phosphatase YigB (HAD superfamily)